MIAAELLDLPAAELMKLLLAGHPIDPTSLDDREYDGTSLGLPHLVERLTWKRFRKAFHRDPATGRLRGWNIRIDNRQPGYTPLTRRGVPITFGHFAVVAPAGYRMPQPATRGLLLDYGVGNGRFDPLSRLRDPLVALHPDDPSLLLGWTYLDLGLTQVGTPSFFSLQRSGPLSRVP